MHMSHKVCGTFPFILTRTPQKKQFMNSADDSVRLEARVYGRVQGVYFRESTRSLAQSLNITGWIKNNQDGSVSVVAEGSRPQLEALLDYLREGPTTANVERVAPNWAVVTGEFNSFQTRWW